MGRSHGVYALRNGKLRVIFGGWKDEKRKATLEAGGKHFYDQLAEDVKVLMEVGCHTNGKRGKFVAWRMRRNDIDEMWIVVKAFKALLDALPTTSEYHGFWCSPDRTSEVRKITRALRLVMESIKEKHECLAEVLEVCCSKKVIYAGDERIVRCTSLENWKISVAGATAVGIKTDDIKVWFRKAVDEVKDFGS